MVPAIDAEMRDVLTPRVPNLHLFYGMLHYHMGWVDDEFAPLTVNSGKRIRPVLCLLTTEAAGWHWEQALPAGAALEMLHNFSLIHDDIQDVSPTRRGRLTLWQVWGAPRPSTPATPCLPPPTWPWSAWPTVRCRPNAWCGRCGASTKVCIELTIGQHLDMDFETRPVVRVDEYLAMIDGKTAVLLALSAELGAIVAGADGATINHYAQFGLGLGWRSRCSTTSSASGVTRRSSASPPPPTS